MKFYALLKKELKEMLNLQNIILLIFMLVIMYSMGGMMSSTMEKATEESAKVSICDLDNTDFSKSMIGFIKHPTPDMKNEVDMITLESDDYAAELKRLKLKSFIIIPEGFTDAVAEGKQADVIYVSEMTSLSTMSNINSGSETAVSLIESALKSAIYSNKVSKGQLTSEEVTQLNAPVNIKEHTIVGSKSAEISQLILYSSVYTQSLFMPLVVYFLILLGSQAMINTVTAEKIDKTLETLLSAPISRLSVISAKMLSAAVVALLNAVVYLVGMNSMTSSVTGNVPDEYTSVIAELGLVFSTKHYVFIGIQMLLSTLIALALAMILGAFAKDIKSSQILVMPIMFITIIPFMASMFVDISSLSGPVKYILYAIPFTHTFMASDCVIFGKDSLYMAGLIYQIIFLALTMFIAIKIFTTDTIFTITESKTSKKLFGKKSKTVQPEEN